MNIEPTDGSEVISRLYGSYYYAHDCGKPYQRDDHWLAFFDRIAKRIIEDIQPKTVLDAGCAYGFLVECLRKRGIESWGIDISSYAIEQVSPDFRPYCQVGSLTETLPDKLPKNYDLVVTIEVLEHLIPGKADIAVDNICQITRDVLFSASYQDYSETTHLNIQPPDYWVQQFARLGFYRDVDFDTEFVTPWAMRFRKGIEPIHQVLREYERRMWLLQKEVRELRRANLEMMGKLQEFSQKLPGEIGIDGMSATIKMDARMYQLYAKVKSLEDEVADWNIRWADAQSGAGWRMLESLRRLRLRIIPPGTHREKWFYHLIHQKEQ